ncbi:MAG: hypothetical protein AAF354_04030 [Pseudomonadota bacterium]
MPEPLVFVLTLVGLSAALLYLAATIFALSVAGMVVDAWRRCRQERPVPPVKPDGGFSGEVTQP